MTIRHPALCRTGAALAACLLLSACLLTSETPRFAEADLEPILGDVPTHYDLFRRKMGAWVADDSALTVTLIPQGRHYLMPDPENPDSGTPAAIMGFLPLADGNFAVQWTVASDANPEQGFYGTATWDGHDLILGVIECDDLHDRTDIADLVAFSEEDCTLLPISGDASQAMDRLVRGLPPGHTKLILRP